jgi:DNA modification methylase
MKIRTAENITTGWTDCGHDSWRPGVVLDPFGGSGTTGRVATGLGRDAWLIDLDGKNLDLARERCGMFLEEVEWNTTQNN